MIPWELCKKMKFDPTIRWYMHNPTSVLENETHKFLWDFEIQTDHLISIIINKKRGLAESWTFLSKVKLKEIEKKDKYMDLAREFKK